MANNKQSGDIGEKEVVDLIPCPNCGKKLMILPPNYPMYDVQCTACNFRAQVKTANRPPCNIVRGSGYDIYEKVLKAGYLAPPLFVNFRWKGEEGNIKREIRFYPFVSKGNISKYTLSEKARRANYRMFNYVKLDKIPHMVLLQELNPNLGEQCKK